MPLPPLLILCVGGVVCLAPVVVYLGWVGGFHRRPRPTVVAGPWDFVALLASLAGFALFGGGVAFAGVMSNVRVLLRGNAAQARAAWDDDHLAWLAATAAYLLVAAAVVVGGMLLRARSLAVYNIDRDRAEAAVDAALAAAGIPARRSGNLWADGAGVVEVRPFDGMRHATIWLVDPDPRRRQEVERALRHALLATPAGRPGLVAAGIQSVTLGLGASVVGFLAVIALATLSR